MEYRSIYRLEKNHYSDFGKKSPDKCVQQQFVGLDRNSPHLFKPAEFQHGRIVTVSSAAANEKLVIDRPTRTFGLAWFGPHISLFHHNRDEIGFNPKQCSSFIPSGDLNGVPTRSRKVEEITQNDVTFE